MRRITLIAHVSLDGIVQAPGGPEEDTAGGFVHGGWAVPFHDGESGDFIDAGGGQGFDLLLGRRTYDIFAGYWPGQAGPMADALNGAHKVVATHRADDLPWGPVTAIGGDLAAGIARIKETDGPDLVVWGSSTLAPVLIGAGLADALRLMVFPVMIGTGKRIFGDAGRPAALTLVDSRATSSGVMLSVYHPAGPMRTGTFGPDGG